MPYWAWVVAPLVWCFIPSWLLSSKSWNFIKSGYEILRLSIKCTRLENIYNYSTHSKQQERLVESVQEKKGQGKLSLAPPNLLLNWEFHAPLKPSVLFFCPVFWNLIPYVTKQGEFRCRPCLALRITLLSWRIGVSFRGFFEDYIFKWWNIWVSIILLNFAFKILFNVNNGKEHVLGFLKIIFLNGEIFEFP